MKPPPEPSNPPQLPQPHLQGHRLRPPSYNIPVVLTPSQPGAQSYPQFPQMPPMPQTPRHAPGIIIQNIALGKRRTRIVCPSCHAEVLTTVKFSANCKTHFCALFLCLIFCWPCICVPYCVNSCKSASHYCPNCNAFIAKN